jgi:hypothetical protein
VGEYLLLFGGGSNGRGVTNGGVSDSCGVSTVSDEAGGDVMMVAVSWLFCRRESVKTQIFGK